MGQMFLILLRILFPLDPVARYRELMRSWLGMVMSGVDDPEELASYAYWSEDRAKLESCICFLEYAMQVLIHDRTRQMLGQRYVYMPLQDKPHIRHPKSLNQLLKRLGQIARDFHALDALAARRAERMREDATLTPSLRDSPLRLDAAHQSTSPGFAGGGLRGRCAFLVLPRQGGGGGLRALARKTEGAARLRADASARADLQSPIDHPLPTADHLARQRARSPPLDLTPPHWPPQPMRLILAAAFAVLAACSEKPPEPATAQHVSDPTAIIAADRAFAAEAATTGWVEASEQWSEPDAIVLGATAPESAKQFYASIDPANRKDTTLHWAPEFAGASAAGDFGFTTGPFNGDGAAFGYYLSVWRQQPTGEWRWVYNGGVDTTTPTTIDPAFHVAFIDPPAGGEGAADIAKTTVAVLEAGLAISTSNDAPLALGAQFAANAQVQRQNAAPVIGDEAITKALETGPRAITFKQLQSHASAAGDLVFTLGEARWQDDTGVDGSGLYGRIWSYTSDGWRIVFDQIVLRDLPAAQQ